MFFNVFEFLIEEVENLLFKRRAGLSQRVIPFIAVCIYHLVMISIDLSETARFAHWKSEITSETIFF